MTRSRGRYVMAAVLALTTAACGQPGHGLTVIRLTEPGEPARWAHCLHLPDVSREADASADGPPASRVAVRVAGDPGSDSVLDAVGCFEDAGLGPEQIQVVPG